MAFYWWLKSQYLLILRCSSKIINPPTTHLLAALSGYATAVKHSGMIAFSEFLAFLRYLLILIAHQLPLLLFVLFIHSFNPLLLDYLHFLLYLLDFLLLLLLLNLTLLLLLLLVQSLNHKVKRSLNLRYLLKLLLGHFLDDLLYFELFFLLEAFQNGLAVFPDLLHWFLVFFLLFLLLLKNAVIIVIRLRIIIWLFIFKLTVQILKNSIKLVLVMPTAAINTRVMTQSYTSHYILSWVIYVNVLQFLN